MLNLQICLRVARAQPVIVVSMWICLVGSYISYLKVNKKLPIGTYCSTQH